MHRRCVALRHARAGDSPFAGKPRLLARQPPHLLPQLAERDAKLGL
jgi:hypothetical protein